MDVGPLRKCEHDCVGFVIGVDFEKSGCLKAFEKRKYFWQCLSRGEFGDSLGSLTNSMLGKFTGEHEADGSLDLSAGAVLGKARMSSRRCGKKIVLFSYTYRVAFLL
jgi:hypothetical protein